MRQLRTLLTQGVQMVFLTATLPPRIQGEFIRIIKINPCKVHMFRAPTTRMNIAYSVFEHDPDENKADTACRLIQGKLAQYPAPAKIIVYGGTIERTTELSQALDCHKYYREVSDREEKEEIMER
jgi:superfamily II DNA/RNA helicase